MIILEGHLDTNLLEPSCHCTGDSRFIFEEFFDSPIRGDNYFIRSNVLGSAFELRNKGVMISPDLYVMSKSWCVEIINDYNRLHVITVPPFILAF